MLQYFKLFKLLLEFTNTVLYRDFSEQVEGHHKEDYRNFYSFLR